MDAPGRHFRALAQHTSIRQTKATLSGARPRSMSVGQTRGPRGGAARSIDGVHGLGSAFGGYRRASIVES